MGSNSTWLARKPCLILYINYQTDVIITELKNLEKIIELLNKEFEMKDLSELEYFFRIQVTPDRLHRIHILQTAYINKILERFRIESCNPVSTPLATGIRLFKSKEETNQTPYQQLIGS